MFLQIEFREFHYMNHVPFWLCAVSCCSRAWKLIAFQFQLCLHVSSCWAGQDELKKTWRRKRETISFLTNEINFRNLFPRLILRWQSYKTVFWPPFHRYCSGRLPSRQNVPNENLLVLRCCLLTLCH